MTLSCLVCGPLDVFSIDQYATIIVTRDCMGSSRIGIYRVRDLCKPKMNISCSYISVSFVPRSSNWLCS